MLKQEKAEVFPGFLFVVLLSLSTNVATMGFKCLDF